MQRTFFISLASAAFAMVTGISGVSPALAGNTRDTVRSEYFTARVLKVESDAPGSRWVTVEFTAVPLSQAEAVTLRPNDANCSRPAFLMDAKGNKFLSADCSPGAPAHDRWALSLDYPADPPVRRFHFVGPSGVSGGPYDIVIPITYTKVDEEDRRLPAIAQVLSFVGIE